MTRKLFGTDGIRGTANQEPMTPQTAMSVALAAGAVFRKGQHRHRVVIGKDTRLSGYTLEPALTSGFCAAGMDVVLTGPVPTPAVGMLVRSLRCDLGVMLSASHNPYTDNGVKLFGPDGFKLSDDVEAEIEAKMAKTDVGLLAAPEALGRAKRLDDVIGRYNEFVKRALPREQRLDGLKAVVDCANGAAYRVAPTVLYELGAEVVPIGVSPNGTNINKDCGATDPTAMREAVVAHGADIGIALDGDADRVILCDENGTVIDGDQVMALIAKNWLDRGRLTGGHVVATVMSNLGLERFLEEQGIGLKRTRVGDRYVVEAMRAEGCNLGGEQSGHIVMTDFATTGDGLIAGLQVLSALVESGKPASEVTRLFQPYPQLLENVRYGGGQPLDNPGVQQAIKEGEAQLGSSGRLVIRKSGTEPLIRVMAEGKDEVLIAKVVGDIAKTIGAVAAE